VSVLYDEVERALGKKVPTKEVSDLQKMVREGKSTCYLSKFGDNEILGPGYARERPNDIGDILRDSGVIGPWETVEAINSASLPAEVKKEVKKSGSLKTVWIEELPEEQGVINTKQQKGILRISCRIITDVKIGKPLIGVEGHCNTAFSERNRRHGKNYASKDLRMVFPPEELKERGVRIYRIVKTSHGGNITP
jgi:hypothetical protein